MTRYVSTYVVNYVILFKIFGNINYFHISIIKVEYKFEAKPAKIIFLEILIYLLKLYIKIHKISMNFNLHVVLN